MSIEVKKYYYCKTDLSGQRTGDISIVFLDDTELTFDHEDRERANKYFNGIFLFEDRAEAVRAAMS